MRDMEIREPVQAFKVRFSDPRTRSALQAVANQLGLSMNEVADRAIEHEVMLSSALVASDLEAAAANLRALSEERYQALLAKSYVDYAGAEARPEVLPARQLPSTVVEPVDPDAVAQRKNAFDGFPLPGTGE